MEAKFYKDYKHNYMVLRCRQAVFLDTYSYKMLSMGKAQGLLKCSTRYMNNEAYLYYEIGSAISLHQMYQHKKMGYEQIEGLLSDIEEMLEELNKFFMEERDLVLQPEFLYYDFTLHRYRGVYYPEEGAVGGDYEPLLDFLLEHVDTDNQPLTDAVYQFYEKGMEGSFSIGEALQLLEESCGLPEEKQETAVPECGNRARIDGVEPEEEVRWKAVGLPEENMLEDIATETFAAKGKVAGKKIQGGKFWIFFSVFSFLGLIAALAVWYGYTLSQEEEMILFGCIAVMGGCFLVGVIQFVRNRIGKKSAKESKRTGKEEDITEEFIYEEIPSLEKVLDRDMNIAVARCEYPERKESNRETRACRNERQNSEEYGGTVFFEESVITGHKLYALDKKNKKHIDFDKLPCTIGSLPGYADIVLDGKSVSRIHARLEREGDKVMLTDLNSTNGTFKNGLRMEPQETVQIEPGDEVRFGQICYCYR